MEMEVVLCASDCLVGASRFKYQVHILSTSHQRLRQVMPHQVKLCQIKLEMYPLSVQPQ